MEVNRRNNKSEYQECACKMDKSLNRGMFNKSESRNIYVAGYQCDHREPTQSVCVADCSERSDFIISSRAKRE